MSLSKAGWAQRFFACVASILFLSTSAPASQNRDSEAMAHYIMAVMYDDLGQLDDAVAEYTKVLQQDSKNLLVRLNLAAVYIKKKDRSRAIEQLQAAVKLDGQAVEPHAILALLYSSENKIDLATREYEIALKNAATISPGNSDIYKTLGAIYLHQKRFAEAKQTYELAIKFSPRDAESYFYLANIYDELKESSATEQNLKTALELKPDYHEALNYLGYFYVEQGKNLAAAESMIRKALVADPDNGAYVDSLGWLYFRTGRVKEAIRELERATVLLEDPVIYLHLGEAYHAAGDERSARLNWKKSLELDPDQDEMKKKLEIHDKI